MRAQIEEKTNSTINGANIARMKEPVFNCLILLQFFMDRVASFVLLSISTITIFKSVGTIGEYHLRATTTLSITSTSYRYIN